MNTHQPFWGRKKGYFFFLCHQQYKVKKVFSLLLKKTKKLANIKISEAENSDVLAFLLENLHNHMRIFNTMMRIY